MTGAIINLIPAADSLFYGFTGRSVLGGNGMGRPSPKKGLQLAPVVHRRYSPLCLLKRRAFSLASLPHRLLRAHDAREVRLHKRAVGTMDGPEAEYGLVARLSQLARKAH
jgi:hypothetical protein